MRAYCTVCSRKKLETSEAVPAIDLYLSDNIKKVYFESQNAGLEFRILSGKFGLLKPEDKIKPYDYLLKHEAVKELKERVIEQISSQGIDKINFYAENREKHPNWVPYYNAIIGACNELRIPIRLLEI